MIENIKKKSYWGVGIAALYTSFALFIITVVIFATFQDFSLVEENYYSKELLYQQQIDRIKNHAALSNKPYWNIDRETNRFLLSFPDSLAVAGISGTVHFFRPSSKQHDQVIPIRLDDTYQMEIPLMNFIKGQWRIKLRYESGGVEYYDEKMLTI